MTHHNKLDFPCVTCGAETTVKQCKTFGGLTRRTRVCRNRHAFRTYQNGGGEVFDCYFASGANAHSIEYRQKKQAYNRLRIICEMYGDRRVLGCLERARQKAGIRK